MSRIKLVRDPLYNYIELTPVELCVIDRPEFQRLRFVLQNSTAYLTYPANFNSRFLHSLGVMHLSGLMFARALQSADQKVLSKFLNQCDELITKWISALSLDDVEDGWRESIGNASGFNHRPVTSVAMTPSDRQLFIINSLWQAVRLCALIHDIGHLPLSHLFEEARREFKDMIGYGDVLVVEDDRRLKAFKKTLLDDLKGELGSTDADMTENKITHARAFHELNGLMLIHQRIRTKLPKQNETNFGKLTFHLAKLIFITNARPLSKSSVDDNLRPLRCLHTIIAGDLDADRLDYCVRDPQSSGLELGAIDVKRIVDSLVLHQEGVDFRILPHVRAMSAIEAFFHQRYQMYKNLVYHHNVVRMNGVVKQAIVYLLRERADNNADRMIVAELDRFGFWYTSPQRGYGASPSEEGYLILCAPIEQYDDAWLRTMFSAIFQKLDEKVKIMRQGDKAAKLDNSRLHGLWLLLGTFLYRKAEHVFSLWKRDSDYRDTIAAVSAEMTQKPKGYDWLVVPDYNLKFWDLVVDPLRRDLAHHSVILICDFLAPKIFAKRSKTGPEEVAVITDTGKCEDISRVSPYLASLRAVADQTPNIHFSFVAEDLKQKPSLMDTCKKLAFARLREYATFRSLGR